MENKLESGFNIKNIVLLESNFSRINNVVFSKDVKNDLNINIAVNIKDNSILVVETVDVKQMFQEIEQVTIHVKMSVQFEEIGNSEIKDLDTFGRVNGAAILFPYIREHITNLSLKAGVGAIILPPINFTKTVDKETKTN